ncbi:helix-turn-helix domain-containing protein [Enterococcus termitis]
MSYYHLSRLFKKQVGTTFTDYINQVRLMRATEALLLTTDSVIQIAMNAGFSSPEIFHRVFKKQHGLTPSNYRKKYSLTKIQDNQTLKSRKYQEISGASALQELAKYLVGKDIEDENTAIEQRMKFTITKASNPMYQSSKKIIKIGPASEGLAGGVQRELHILREELAFDFVQFEGFCEETNFENNVMLVSEYILNNQWFDFLIKIQLKPIIQLFLPEDCIDKKNVQFWCDKQIKIIRHFLNRYGYEEVGQWYVQWSLPKNNNRWSEESRWGYHYFYRKLKRLIPSFKIGLMSLRSLSETEYKQYEEFIEEQSKYHCLPDFISFHADPYVTSTVKDKYALDFKDYQKKLITRVKSVVSKYAKSKIQDFSNWEPEIFLTEWNTLVGEGNTFSGTFFRSALILESIVELSKEVTGIAFWLNIKVKERQSHKRG